MLQDEHILARKYADKWMAKALGMGLFKRRLYRKEVEDTRQLLFSSLNPLAKVSCCLRDQGVLGFRVFSSLNPFAKVSCCPQGLGFIGFCPSLTLLPGYSCYLQGLPSARFAVCLLLRRSNRGSLLLLV